jgi:glycosyltransferase involved in cell wall biosynthesis
MGAIASGARFVHRNLGEPLYWAADPVRRLRTRILLRTADVVVALWSQAARDLVNHFGVPPERVRVIPRGASGSRFRPATPDERADAVRLFGLDAGTRTIAYVGSLSPEKNVAAAVAAVGDIPDSQLLIVGSGPERDSLEALASRAAPGRVRFFGSTPAPERAFSAADVLVLPSRTEGIPAVLVEGCLSGLPAVASAVGGIPEIVEDGVTGRLVPPGDVGALTEALRDVLARPERMGELARERCLERYELGAVVDAYCDLLREIAIPLYRSSPTGVPDARPVRD